MQTKILSILTLAFIMMLFQSPVQAQIARSKAGDVEVGAKLGLLSIYRIDRAQTITPPLQVEGEYFVTSNFSLGAFASYVAAEGDRSYAEGTITEHYSNETWALGLRTTTYTNLLGDKWRIYGGLAIGAAIPQIETTIHQEGEPKTVGDLPMFSPEPTNALLFSGFVGAQYYLRTNVSLTGEVGYGLSLVNVGVRYKL